MQLRPRVVLTSLVVALPAAILLLLALNSIRDHDMALALERVVKSQLNDQVRERCESDPTWFVTGPLEGRPRAGDPVTTNPDVMAPRAKVTEQPFELFAFDEDFLGSSPATPRFPNELRFALRRSTAPAFAPFVTPDGTGVQMATWTSWTTGPCAVLLGRLRPEPHAKLQQVGLFIGLFTMCTIVALVAMAPTIRRIRRLAADAHDAAREQHASIAPDRLRDELSSVAFVYNDTAKALHEQATVSKDREDALRRFIDETAASAGPLTAVASRIDALEGRVGGPAIRDEVRRAARDVHDVGGRLANLALAAELHARRSAIAREPVDLVALVTRVVSRFEEVARAAEVTIASALPDAPLVASANARLLDHALGNLVDNAIRYNKAGGTVQVEVRAGPSTDARSPAGSSSDENFTIKLRDTGIGVTDEELKGLTAIRRFRGDEGRDRRPGVPGLGLAIAREVIERHGWRLDLGRPTTGGLEVEITGAVTSLAPAAGPR